MDNYSAIDTSRLNRPFTWLIIALFIVGLVSRLAPLLDHGGRLLRQFPTEDGYLMLTIARNLAIGNGMSTADGTIPTNGTQPGATFIYACCYWLVSGNKIAGVKLVLVLQAIVALASSFMIYKLGRLFLAEHKRGATVAALSAGVWFSAGGFVPHTMNCLETGLYVLCILFAVYYFLAVHRRQNNRWTYKQCLMTGLLLGICFWMRNDAALLIAAICFVHLLWTRKSSDARWPHRLGESIWIGTTSLIVASPWLMYNYIYFGHLMPISGISEAAYITFGENLSLVPIVFAEYALTVIPIPAGLENNPLVWSAAIALTAGWITLLVFITRRCTYQERLLLLTITLYALMLSVFYGLFFGAGHFLARYFFPLSPFTTLLWSWVAVYLWDIANAYRTKRFYKPIPRITVQLAPVILAFLAVGLNLRLYLKGNQHEHFQVVEWVANKIPASAWVGAPQTGTLGYFHDRTINLDGKVNPEALQARLQNRIPHYVLRKKIHYLADWVGLAKWTKLPLLRAHFELIVEDHQNNLAILKKNDLPLEYTPFQTTDQNIEILHLTRNKQ